MKVVPQLVVGTAGHIDHGKSRLVFAITGTDPDRLPEEKARGMTIDLGFAHVALDGCDVWFVDVPGHERFIRNMVAGATGVDAALLVVAADDSVMPQTREHAEVLSLLGVDRCIVALTKMDLVDDEWAEQVEEEVRELLDSLHIEPIRFVRTSAESGRGIDELRRVLSQAARAQCRVGTAHQLRQRAPCYGGQCPPYDWFRLPMDRAFNIAGRGTVVTGSVLHGSVTREDELELWPAGRRVRVRGLQTHYEVRSAAAGHMRLALNLAGVTLDQVGRGCELATPGYLETSTCMDVWVAALRMPGKARRQRLRLRLHLATSEALAELRLIDRPAGDTVGGQFAQLRIARPVVATWGQRFILRDESGSRTLGGGRVVRPVARPWSTKRPASLQGLGRLLEGSANERLEEVLRANEWRVCPNRRLATRAGLSGEDQASAGVRRLVDRGNVHLLEAASARLCVHVDHVKAATRHVTCRLTDHLKANPRLAGVARSAWPGWMPRACPKRVQPTLADWMLQTGQVALADGYVVPRGHAAAMSAEDQALFDAILRELRDGAFQPPAVKALGCITPRNAKRVRELIALAAARGRLVRIAEDLWLHADRWTELTQRVSAAIRERGDLTVSEIRTLLDSSRKYAVPIAELLDARGITRRVGDHRTLGPNAPGS